PLQGLDVDDDVGQFGHPPTQPRRRSRRSVGATAGRVDRQQHPAGDYRHRERQQGLTDEADVDDPTGGEEDDDQPQGGAQADGEPAPGLALEGGDATSGEHEAGGHHRRPRRDVARKRDGASPDHRQHRRQETDRRCRDDQRAEVAEAGSGAALLARRQRSPHILDRLDALQLVDLDRLGGSLFPQAGHDPGQAAGGCGDSEGESEANVVVGGEDHLLAFDPEVESVGLGAHFDFRERPGPNLGAPGGEEGEGFVLQMDPHGDTAGVVAGHAHRPGHPRVDHWSAPGRPRPPVEGADRIRTDRRCGQQLWRMSGRGLYPRHVPEIIYTTYRLSRHYPPDRTVLSDISLSFYYGAKIGVIGPNGAGKSSLLRIMAGLDDGYEGEARISEGYTVGLLEQEPYLDPSKTVHENVMDGVAEVKA